MVSIRTQWMQSSRALIQEINRLLQCSDVGNLHSENSIRKKLWESSLKKQSKTIIISIFLIICPAWQLTVNCWCYCNGFSCFNCFVLHKIWQLTINLHLEHKVNTDAQPVQPNRLENLSRNWVLKWMFLIKRLDLTAALQPAYTRGDEGKTWREVCNSHSLIIKNSSKWLPDTLETVQAHIGFHLVEDCQAQRVFFLPGPHWAGICWENSILDTYISN